MLDDDLIEALQMRITALEEKIVEIEESNESWGRLVIRLASHCELEPRIPLSQELKEELKEAKQRMEYYPREPFKAV